MKIEDWDKDDIAEIFIILIQIIWHVLSWIMFLVTKLNNKGTDALIFWGVSVICSTMVLCARGKQV